MVFLLGFSHQPPVPLWMLVPPWCVPTTQQQWVGSILPVQFLIKRWLPAGTVMSNSAPRTTHVVTFPTCTAPRPTWSPSLPSQITARALTATHSLTLQVRLSWDVWCFRLSAAFCYDDMWLMLLTTFLTSKLYWNTFLYKQPSQPWWKGETASWNTSACPLITLSLCSIFQGLVLPLMFRCPCSVLVMSAMWPGMLLHKQIYMWPQQYLPVWTSIMTPAPPMEQAAPSQTSTVARQPPSRWSPLREAAWVNPVYPLLSTQVRECFSVLNNYNS